MENELSQKNRERLLQIGTAIAYLRKKCGLSQEKLAAKAGISRSLLSSIE
ncbi:MAG: helix-turn-helix transcriptional regulator, partial [Clostridiales bacterium]|nr:helix-turn-helix transcriptional regulator [Clostridiales bacterium]